MHAGNRHGCRLRDDAIAPHFVDGRVPGTVRFDRQLARMRQTQMPDSPITPARRD
jgi:hypothetical protein